MKCNRRTAGFLLAACVIACVIFGNSLLNSETSNEISGALSETLQAVLDPDGTIKEYEFHKFFRKMAHVTEFAVLGAALSVLMCRIQKKTGRYPVFMILFLALATGVADEFLQNFTGRSSTVKDVLIDFCGALLGIVLTMLVTRLRRNRQNKYTTTKEHSFLDNGK